MVLFAFWVDRALSAHPERAGLGPRSRWLSAVPALAAALLCLFAIALPGPLESFFEVVWQATQKGRLMTPFFVIDLVLALVVAALVLSWRVVPANRRPAALAAVVGVDIALFVAFSSTGLAPGHVTLQPERSQAVAVLGSTGRFGIFDTTAQNLKDLTMVGQPDLQRLHRPAQRAGVRLAGGQPLRERHRQPHPRRPRPLRPGPGGVHPAAPLLDAGAQRVPAPAASSDDLGDPASCPGAPAPGTADRAHLVPGLGPDGLLGSPRTHRGRDHPGPRRARDCSDAGGKLTWPATSRVRAPGGGGRHVAHPTPALGVVVRGDARASRTAPRSPPPTPGAPTN